MKTNLLFNVMGNEIGTLQMTVLIVLVAAFIFIAVSLRQGKKNKKEII